jgi:hypothetical protein
MLADLLTGRKWAELNFLLTATLRLPWPLRGLSETSYNLLILEVWRLFCDACIKSNSRNA